MISFVLDFIMKMQNSSIEGDQFKHFSISLVNDIRQMRMRCCCAR